MLFKKKLDFSEAEKNANLWTVRFIMEYRTVY